MGNFFSFLTKFFRYAPVAIATAEAVTEFTAPGKQMGPQKFAGVMQVVTQGLQAEGLLAPTAIQNPGLLNDSLGQMVNGMVGVMNAHQPAAAPPVAP
jgi:hypothetical protein